MNGSLNVRIRDRESAFLPIDLEAVMRIAN
jgi:hypothetical protein